MIRRPPRSTRVRSSAASDVYKRQTQALEQRDAVGFAHEGVPVAGTLPGLFEQQEIGRTVFGHKHGPTGTYLHTLRILTLVLIDAGGKTCSASFERWDRRSPFVV